MSLKKSDKIIAIVGVIILIIAGIGIVLYSSSDEDTEIPTNKNEDKMMYDVTYTISAPMQVLPDNTVYSIKPKLLNTKPYVGEVMISQKNLQSVNFYLKYTDNVKGFLMGRLLKGIGADTLTVTIKDSEGNIIISNKGKGALTVNETFEFNSLISLEPIEAMDMTTAKGELEKRYIDNQESYKITVSLKTGLWGKFRELLSKDSFKLDITYTYYEYNLELENQDNNPGEPDDNYPPMGSNMGCGVYSATNFGLTKL